MPEQNTPEGRERYYMTEEEEQRLDEQIRAIETRVPGRPQRKDLGEIPSEIEGVEVTERSLNSPQDIALLQLTISHLVRKYGPQVITYEDLEKEFTNAYGLLMLVEPNEAGTRVGKVALSVVTVGANVQEQGQELVKTLGLDTPYIKEDASLSPEGSVEKES